MYNITIGLGGTQRDRFDCRPQDNLILTDLFELFRFLGQTIKMMEAKIEFAYGRLKRINPPCPPFYKGGLSLGARFH